MATDSKTSNPAHNQEVIDIEIDFGENEIDNAESIEIEFDRPSTPNEIYADLFPGDEDLSNLELETKQNDFLFKNDITPSEAGGGGDELDTTDLKIEMSAFVDENALLLDIDTGEFIDPSGKAVSDAEKKDFLASIAGTEAAYKEEPPATGFYAWAQNLFSKVFQGPEVAPDDPIISQIEVLGQEETMDVGTKLSLQDAIREIRAEMTSGQQTPELGPNSIELMQSDILSDLTSGLETPSNEEITEFGRTSTIDGETIVMPFDESQADKVEKISPNQIDSRIEGEVTTRLEETQEITLSPKEKAYIDSIDLGTQQPTVIEPAKNEINMTDFDTFPGFGNADIESSRYYQNLQQHEAKEVFVSDMYNVVSEGVEDPLAEGEAELVAEEMLPEWNTKETDKNLNPASYYNPNAYYFVTHEAHNAKELLKNPTLPINVSAEEILQHSTNRAAVEASRDNGLISESRYMDILREAHSGHDIKLHANEVIAFGLIGYRDADQVLQNLRDQKQIGPEDYSRFSNLKSITASQHKNGLELGDKSLSHLHNELEHKNKQVEQVLSGSKRPLEITKEQITNAGLKSASEDVAKDHGLIHIDRYQSIINRLQSDGVAKMWPEEAVAFGLFSDEQSNQLLEHLHNNGDITDHQMALEPPKAEEKELGKNILHATMYKFGMSESNIDDMRVKARIAINEAKNEVVEEYIEQNIKDVSPPEKTLETPVPIDYGSGSIPELKVIVLDGSKSEQKTERNLDQESETMLNYDSDIDINP